MRRSDREIKSFDEIMDVINRNEVLRLGLAKDNMPYVVPMNYGAEAEGETVTFYLHCAIEGMKLDYIKANPNVCVEIDSKHELIEGETACDASYKYESVICFGKAEIVDGFDNKINGLKVLMKSITGKTYDSFNEKMVEHIEVIKITTSEVFGKRRS